MTRPRFYVVDNVRGEVRARLPVWPQRLVYLPNWDSVDRTLTVAARTESSHGVFDDGKDAWFIEFGHQRSPLVLGALGDVPEGRLAVEPVETSSSLLCARALAEFVVFNPTQIGGHRDRYRGFRRADADRVLVDVVRTGAPPVALPSTAGVPLRLLVETSIEQGARVNRALAAAMLLPLCDADVGSLSEHTTFVTWDGAVRAWTERTTLPSAHGRASAQQVLLYGKKLVDGTETLPKKAINDDAALAILAAWKASANATADDVAAFVRSLFPSLWQAEQELREEVAMLDDDAIDRIVTSSSS